jgi:hypothetical protein
MKNNTTNTAVAKGVYIADFAGKGVTTAQVEGKGVYIADFAGKGIIVLGKGIIVL